MIAPAAPAALPLSATPLAILERPDVRLLTLTGPGGTGKARLALALAAQLTGRSTDGAVFVDRSPIAEPELVASAVAQAVQVRDRPGQPLAAALAAFLPVFAGTDYARDAVAAAEGLQRATGHWEPGGPWLPVGTGVHTGICCFGTVKGADGTFADFTALGDAVNVAARLAASAQPGEALVSEATVAAAGIDPTPHPARELALRGNSEPVRARAPGGGAHTGRLLDRAPAASSAGH